MQPQALEVVLRDWKREQDPNRHQLTLQVLEDCITVGVPGVGTLCFLEVDQGRLTLNVWPKLDAMEPLTVDLEDVYQDALWLSRDPGRVLSL